MLTKFNLFCEDIVRSLNKSNYVPVKFIDGSAAFGTDFKR